MLKKITASLTLDAARPLSFFLILWQIPATACNNNYRNVRTFFNWLYLSVVSTELVLATRDSFLCDILISFNTLRVHTSAVHFQLDVSNFTTWLAGAQ